MIRVVLAGIGEFQELRRMILAFYPEAQVEFTADPGIVDTAATDWRLWASVGEVEQGVRCEVEFYQGAQVARAERTLKHSPGTPQKPLGSLQTLKKRALLLAVHDVLGNVAGRSLPWGVLFGVRPGKILHEMLRRRGVLDNQPAQEMLVQEYGMRRDRASLLVEVVEQELRALPDLYQLANAVSLYVGIPFCPTRCAYCTFPSYSMVDKARYAEDFMAALKMEIQLVGELLRDYRIPVTTVYIGGGTPTSLKAAELEALFTWLRESMPDSGRWREFTVEAGRADTITPDRVQVMRAFGVNRVSVNPQSFVADTLKRVGRGHSPAAVDKSFELFREAGFTNINMDLIAGLPGENLGHFKYSLARTLALSPDSVTVHTLSFKRGAEMTKVRGLTQIPSDDETGAMLDFAETALRQVGYHPYYLYRQKDILANRENTGYARVGKEGLYNIAIIEEVQSIVALGGGGASKWRDPGSGEIFRQANSSEPQAYVEHIGQVLEKKRTQLLWLAKRLGLH